MKWSHLQTYLHGKFTLNCHQNFALICPYPTCRHVYMQLPSEFHPYSPLPHLQTCLHWMAIRTSPSFTLIPPTDMFTLNRHQNFTLIRPYLSLQICLHWIAIRIWPSENSPSVSFLPWLSSFLFLLASASNDVVQISTSGYNQCLKHCKLSHMAQSWPFKCQGFVSFRNQLHSTTFSGADSKGNQLAFLSLWFLPSCLLFYGE